MMYRAESKTLLQITPRAASRHTQGSFAPTPKSTPLRSPVYALSLAGVWLVTSCFCWVQQCASVLWTFLASYAIYTCSLPRWNPFRYYISGHVHGIQQRIWLIFRRNHVCYRLSSKIRDQSHMIGMIVRSQYIDDIWNLDPVLFDCLIKRRQRPRVVGI